MPQTEVEPEVQRIGRDLHAALPGRSRNPVKAIDARAMELASRDAQLRAALFRLVDVTPACRSLDDLAHTWAPTSRRWASARRRIEAALRATHNARRAPCARAGGRRRGAPHGAPLHRGRVARGRAAHPARAVGRRRGLARWTCWARPRSRARRPTATPSAATRRWTRWRRRWAAGPRGPRWRPTPPGPLPRVNLSVKVSALTPLMRPEAPEVGREDAAERMRPLLRRARDLEAHLHIDMESLDALETTMELVFELLDEEEFATGRRPGVVLQAYLRDSPAQLDRLLEWADALRRARRRSRCGWSRAPTGTTRWWRRASTAGAPPVFEVKAESDRNFEQLTTRLLEARPLIRVAIASHNLRSVAHAVAVNRAQRRRGCRPGAADPARPGRRAAAGAGAQRAAGARLLPGGRPGGGHGLPRAAAAGEHLQRLLPGRAAARRARSRSCWRPREATFSNEPVLELRRAPVRDSLAGGAARAGLPAPAGGAGARGRRPRRRTMGWTPPILARRRGWWRGPGGPARRGRAAVQAAARGFGSGRRARPTSARRCCVAPRRGCANAASSWRR